MQLIVDPVLLGPPRDQDVKRWIEQIRNVGGLIAEPSIEGSCPTKLRDNALARWFAGGPEDQHPTAHELVRIADEVGGRLANEVATAKGMPLLDNVRISPEYVDDLLEKEDHDLFRTHLAEAGCAKSDDMPHLGILSEDESWSATTADVLVEADILGREDPLAGLLDTEGEDATLREFLGRSEGFIKVLSRASEYPCALMDCVEFGVLAFWAGKLDRNPADLDFELGPTFLESIARMNYRRDTRYAASCLRAMALIAGGCAKDVKGHFERDGEGGNNPHRTDANGNAVMRSYLARSSSAANRLFWIDGVRPKFLNVAPHDGGPEL